MGNYRFVLDVNVSDEELAKYNDRGGIQLDTDPAEWNEDNLAFALSEEVALIETIEQQEPR